MIETHFFAISVDFVKDENSLFIPDAFKIEERYINENQYMYTWGIETIFNSFIWKNSLYVLDNVGKIYRLSNHSKIQVYYYFQDF